MKIQGVSKLDEELRSVSRGYRKQKENSRDDRNSEKEFFEFTEENLEKAVRDFGEDVQTQANGLIASAEGHGPGLRVVVKGSDGSVIRQFTGEEFLRLRESVNKVRTGTGKILDQKF